jgi:hypothetical protein
LATESHEVGLTLGPLVFTWAASSSPRNPKLRIAGRNTTFTFLQITLLSPSDHNMASFLRGKQAGIQNDLSAGILPELFAPDDQARYGINSQIGYLARTPEHFRR